MAGELEEVAVALFAALGRADAAEMLTLMTDDAEGVDEISRRWVRGRDAVERYLETLTGSVSDVRTELRDVQERIWGNTGLATC